MPVLFSIVAVSVYIPTTVQEGSLFSTPSPDFVDFLMMAILTVKVKSEKIEVAQSCPTPSDPMDCSPPGPSVRGIFQARVLEWGAIAFSGVPVYLH